MEGRRRVGGYRMRLGCRREEGGDKREEARREQRGDQKGTCEEGLVWRVWCGDLRGFGVNREGVESGL